MGLLYGEVLLLIVGFIMGFLVMSICKALKLSKIWNRWFFIILGALWFPLMILIIAIPRFGSIDLSLGMLPAGLLLHFFLRIYPKSWSGEG